MPAVFGDFDEGIRTFDEAKLYTETYFSYIISDPDDREALIGKALSWLRSSNFSPRSSARLHESLDLILDSHHAGTWQDSLDEVQEESHPLYETIPDSNAIIPGSSGSPTTKKTANHLLKKLPEKTYREIAKLFGSKKDAERVINTLELSGCRTLDEVIAQIGFVSGLSPESRAVYADYLDFLVSRTRKATLASPLRELNAATLPIIKKIVEEVFFETSYPLSIGLEKRGLYHILKESGGAMNLVNLVSPDIEPRSLKWKRKTSSAAYATRLIECMLYKIPGYMEAEANNDRESQVKIINGFIAAEKGLKKYFLKEGLGGMMQGFVDPNGRYGIKKAMSPLAVLEFYDSQKKLGWFDRTKETYVFKWRINEQGMWKNGEDSVKLAIDAVDDALYEDIPGYREMDFNGDREQQFNLLQQFLSKKNNLYTYFKSKGLQSLMANFVDPSGAFGIAKGNSHYAVLEFYYSKKGFWNSSLFILPAEHSLSYQN